MHDVEAVRGVGELAEVLEKKRTRHGPGSWTLYLVTGSAVGAESLDKVEVVKEVNYAVSVEVGTGLI